MDCRYALTIRSDSSGTFTAFLTSQDGPIGGELTIPYCDDLLFRFRTDLGTLAGRNPDIGIQTLIDTVFERWWLREVDRREEEERKLWQKRQAKLSERAYRTWE